MNIKTLMSSDDVIYVGSLLLCLAAARLYRPGSNRLARQTFGSALGLLVIGLVCGKHAHYTLFLITCNLAIMNVCNRLYIHDVCLSFSWLYLVFLFYHVPMSAYALALNQVLALRLVGLASDLNTSDNLKAETVDGLLASGSKFNIQADVLQSDPEMMEMVHYAVSFIGIHKGPYYRWKIFNEYFTQPLVSVEECQKITERKLKKTALFGVMYLWLFVNYSLEEYQSAEFYQYSAVYRIIYNMPQLIRFVLASQMAGLLSAAVCSEAGFVRDPMNALSQPGMIPTVELKELKSASSTLRILEPQEYNYRTIKGYDNKALLLGPTMRQTLRGWDMSVQYWFWVHVYRKIHHNSRFVKSTISFIVWSVWCGLTKNQLILAPTLWLYINLEDEYGDLCSRHLIDTDTAQNLCTLGFSVMRLLCLVYLTPSLILRRRLIQYYNYVMVVPPDAGDARSTLTNVAQNLWTLGFSVMRLLCLVYLTPCLILKRRLIHYYNSVFWSFHLMLVTLGAGVMAMGRPVLRRGEQSRVDLVTVSRSTTNVQNLN